MQIFDAISKVRATRSHDVEYGSGIPPLALLKKNLNSPFLLVLLPPFMRGEFVVAFKGGRVVELIGIANLFCNFL